MTPKQEQTKQPQTMLPIRRNKNCHLKNLLLRTQRSRKNPRNFDDKRHIRKLESTRRYSTLFWCHHSHVSHPRGIWLHKLRPISPREIRLGDNPTVTAEAAGDIILRLPYNGGATLKVLMKDAITLFYVPELGIRLLSCCTGLASRGVTCMFDETGCTLIDKNDNDDILARAIMRENLY
jgi:hypothetical protein